MDLTPSIGFTKTKEKTEKTGREDIKQDSRTLPIVPDDWMRMYGQLADLIGFGQSFRGGTVDDMYRQGTDRTRQGNLGPPALDNYGGTFPTGTELGNLITGGGFENIGNMQNLNMGITQQQVDLFRQAGVPEEEIFALIPELTTDEQYNNYGEGMLFRDEEGVKVKPISNTQSTLPDPSVGSNVGSNYDFAQDFADMDANQLEASQRLAQLRAMSSVGR